MSDLLNQHRLFINQKAKLIEVTNEYKIFDEQGQQIGVIRQEGQSSLKKVARFVGSLDAMMTHTLSVYDANGAKVAGLTRPRTMWKSKVLITHGDGRDAGRIVMKNVLGKLRFAMEDSTGRSLGEIRAENWRAWNFSMVDASDREVGRITKKWAGIGREMFTNADHYMVEIDPSVIGETRLIMLAAAAGIDTAVKQMKG
jgi:uncharacterized protein YxjI